MLVAEKKHETELSRGLRVTWRPMIGTAGVNAGVIEGYQWFVPTTGLWDQPQFVLYISTPSPYSQVVAQLQELAELQPGWDGHDAAVISPGAIARAIEFLEHLNILYRGRVASPLAGPLPDGAVALVWRSPHQEVEINFVDRGQTIEYAVSDRDGRRPAEFQERVGTDFLLSVVVPQYLLG